MPRLVFHPDVSAEIRASYSWYQELAEGLGDDFLDELESAYEAILEFPQT
jgi:toxin ParE1/3/4